MSLPMPIVVVEMPTFVSATRKMLDDEEREELTDFLASNPTAGDVIAGTGGGPESALVAAWKRKKRRRSRDLLLP